MKILARWSVMLTMALTVGFTAVENKVEAASDSANSSQNLSDKNNLQTQLIDEEISSRIPETEKVKNSIISDPIAALADLAEDKKLVKKTVSVIKRSASRAFRATAYCLKGRTANGGSVRRGIVAADRRVIPLGSKIYVDAGAYSGMYTVTDTGGAVKGNKLDIWVPSCSEAIRFGRKSIGVSFVQ